MGDFGKKFPASACWKKKIACSTNVIESLWKKGIKISCPPHPQELNGRPLIFRFATNDQRIHNVNNQKNLERMSLHKFLSFINFFPSVSVSAHFQI